MRTPVARHGLKGHLYTLRCQFLATRTFVAGLAIASFLVPLLSEHTRADTPSPECASIFNQTPAPASYVDPEGKVRISANAFRHANKVIDTDKFTPASNLQSTDGVLEFDGFRHEGRYHHARLQLRPEAIESAIFQTQPFPIAGGTIVAGHVQMRFTLRPGYEIELTDLQDASKKTKVKDFIVSFESALPEGESYGTVDGAFDSTPLVGRVMSGEQKWSEGLNRPFDQYLLNFTDLEKMQLAEILLRRSNSIGLNVFYNTIVRNCTTEIFDALDQLPRLRALVQAGRINPFLTVLGSDPVVGPSILALLERDPLVRRIQDMKDEYAGKLQDLGVAQRPKSNRQALIPGGEFPNEPVVLHPSQQGLTPTQIALLDGLQKEIEAKLPDAMNALIISSLLAAADLDESSNVLESTLRPLLEPLRKRLREVNQYLPEHPYIIQIIFTPFDEVATADLRSMGLRARVSVAIDRAELSDHKRAEVMGKIQKGLDEIDAHASTDIPAYLRSLSLRINLQKDNAFSDMQVLLGLNELTGSVNIQNAQVRLSRIAIQSPAPQRTPWWKRFLTPYSEINRRASALISHRQSLSGPSGAPVVQIRFGQVASILNAPRTIEDGRLHVRDVSRNRFMCWPGRQPTGPFLSGQFGESPIGNSGVARLLNRALRGRNVRMAITDVDLNLAEMKIQSIRVRVGALGLRCLELESVNQQFGGEANAMIAGLVQKLGQFIPVDLLNDVTPVARP